MPSCFRKARCCTCGAFERALTCRLQPEEETSEGSRCLGRTGLRLPGLYLSLPLCEVVPPMERRLGTRVRTPKALRVGGVGECARVFNKGLVQIKLALQSFSMKGVCRLRALEVQKFRNTQLQQPQPGL